MIERLRTRVIGMVDALESAPVPLARWALALASIIVLRHFLEQLAGERRILYFLSYFLHYPLAYVAPLLALTVVLAAFARERADRVARLMLFAWLLTLLPPLLDMVVSRGAGTPEIIGYLIPKGGTLWQAFVNLLNPAYGAFQGPTAGIRLEAAVGCVLAAVYVHLKTRSVLRAVAAFVAVYATMFFFFALPPISAAVARALGSGVEGVQQMFFTAGAVHRAYAGAPPYALSDLSTALVDLFVLVPLLAVFCRMADPERFRAVVRLFDPLAAGARAALAVLGIVLARSLVLRGLGLPAVTHPFDVLSLAGLVIAAVLTQPAAAAMAAGGAGAPHSAAPGGRGPVVASDGLILGTLAALFALSVSYVAMTYVVGILAVAALSHVLPFRLCRITPLAGLLTGAASALLIQLGYSAYTGAAAALWAPKSVVVAALLAPLIAFPVRELLDRDESLLRLADRLGERRARVLAAISAVAACAFVPSVLRSPALGAVFAAGAIVAAIAVTRGSAAAASRVLRATALALAAALAVWGAAEHPRLEDELAATSFADALAAAPGGGAAAPAAAAMNEGIALLQKGDVAGAAAAFRRASEEDPEHVPAYLGEGAAYTYLGRASEAARAFRRALALDPESTKARVGLAQAFMVHTVVDSATAVLETALEKDPGSAEAAYTLACVYRATGDLGRETDLLERAVSADPAHGLAQDRLGDIHLASGRYAEAVAAFKAALLGRMQVQQVHGKLANAYHAMGDTDAAVEELRKEILVSPRAASPHALLGRLLAEQGKLPEARREYETALSLVTDEQLRAVFQRELDRLGR